MLNNLILPILAIQTLFGSVALAADASASDIAGPVLATILRVVDGDTVAVRAKIWIKQEVETSVRIRGIDTPEKRGQCEKEKELALVAQAELERLIVTPDVHLYDIVADKYGNRVVARLVTADGVDVSDHMIRAGLAYPYQGKQKRSWCD